MSYLAGVDEAGRGPLAGPVIAAAVIMPEGWSIAGLTDSKKLSQKKRNILFDIIYEKALSIGVGRADNKEIDRINILQATLKAMQRAISSLTVCPNMVLVDGNIVPNISCMAKAIIGGDLIEPIISAASVVAKVMRDREMLEIHNDYPEYGFSTHKGYPTKAHIEILNRIGPTDIHRQSYAPVRDALKFSTETCD